MRFETITGPVYWASYLVNNDPDGLEPGEQAQADAWKARNDVVNVVGIEEDSERFTWHYALYAPDSGCAGGAVCDYYCEPVAGHAPATIRADVGARATRF